MYIDKSKKTKKKRKRERKNSLNMHGKGMPPADNMMGSIQNDVKFKCKK